MSSEIPHQMSSDEPKSEHQVRKQRHFQDFKTEKDVINGSDACENNCMKTSAEECFIRIYKGVDDGTSYDANAIPRLLHSNVLERMDSKFNRTLTARYVRKPSTAQGKPKINNRSEEKDTTDPASTRQPSSDTQDRTHIRKELSDPNMGLNSEENDLQVDRERAAQGISDRPKNDQNRGPEKINRPKVKSRLKPSGMVGKIKTMYNNLGNNYVHSCVGKKFKSSPESEMDDLPPVVGELGTWRAKSLLKLLDQNADGVDLKLSFFMAACSHDPRNLRPFPDSILDDNDANRHLLYFMAEEIPSVNMLPHCLKAHEPDVLRKELIPVINWLIRCEDPRLELVRHTEYKKILGAVSNSPVEKMPTKIFCIKTRRNSDMEQSWQLSKKHFETKLAYHNCRVEEAHSLLSYGLHNHINSHGVLGPGIYMTENLSICMDRCSPRNTWGKSSIGAKIKTAFIVEFVCNHNVIPYPGQGAPYYVERLPADSGNDSRYFYTKKPKLVKLRYVLVYVVEASNLPRNPFRYTLLRRKIMKYMCIFRISLLIATILMGASSSKRAHGPLWISDCYQKFSTDFGKWSIWNYVETPYIAVPLTDSVPHSCCNNF